ncbi:MAG: hypothetical protein NTW19_10590, partial [Planctomycetota bacterium]|nr:hypothetical protein [Planctomycetota bacterium]
PGSLTVTRRELIWSIAVGILIGSLFTAAAIYFFRLGDGTAGLAASRWIHGDLVSLERKTDRTKPYREHCYLLVKEQDGRNVQYNFEAAYWDRMSKVAVGAPINLRVVQQYVLSGPNCPLVLEARVGDRTLISLQDMLRRKNVDRGIMVAFGIVLGAIGSYFFLGVWRMLRLKRVETSTGSGPTYRLP